MSVAVQSVPSTRERLRDDVRALLEDDHRLLAVVAENLAGSDIGTNSDGSSNSSDNSMVRMGYLFARPAPLGERRVELVLEIPTADPWVPTIADLSYPGGRFEREIRDLFGVVPRDHPLPRRLVRHAHWPRAWHPLLGDRDAAVPPPDFTEDVSSFPFLEVAGDGVYEIPVGPVHAGMIEPGHFRFSVVGETIVRMKARLWYVHRGVERLFEGQPPTSGIALAERISGDTAVGHALAYAMACEEALGLDVAPRHLLARALLLELERMHNHAADLGMILNDVAFGLANVHLQAVREQLLRLNDSVTGHRLLRGGVRLGGARMVALPQPDAVNEAAARIAEVVELALDHPMITDRLTGAAVLHRADAVRMGTLGYVARASGVDLDARRDHGFLVEDATSPASAGGALQFAERPALEESGDVLARFLVRAREVQESARLVVQLTGRLVSPDLPEPGEASGRAAAGTRRGLGIVEAWRGLLCHRVSIGADGRLHRVKVVDPSFMNWPALPVALADTIVPDFPLANKSFNQSYAGNDL